MFGEYSLYRMPIGVETRWASPENPEGKKGNGGQQKHGRKGSPSFPLKAGDRAVLAEVTGTSGVVRRIWSTIAERDARMLRGLRLEFFWDEAEKAAVSVPFGDFFGVGLGRVAPFQSMLFTNPEGRSFNCYVPMPFKKSMKMTVTNESDENLTAFYYDIDYTIGDRHGTDAMYFHACYRRENPTIMQRDYEILPNVHGSGRFLGCNIGINANKQQYYDSWWGEGEVKIYLDGDDNHPTLCGTGTEDYIGTGWGQDCYSHLFQGCTIADNTNMQYCYYRHHIPDPVFFYKDIRVTIQQLGFCSPNTNAAFFHEGNKIYSRDMKPIDFSKDKQTSQYALFERCDDYSSCAYFYLNRPVNDLPDIDQYELRI
jgi:hypothetical protein